MSNDKTMFRRGLTGFCSFSHSIRSQSSSIASSATPRNLAARTSIGASSDAGREARSMSSTAILLDARVWSETTCCVASESGEFAAVVEGVFSELEPFALRGDEMPSSDGGEAIGCGGNEVGGGGTDEPSAASTAPDDCPKGHAAGNTSGGWICPKASEQVDPRWRRGT